MPESRENFQALTRHWLLRKKEEEVGDAQPLGLWYGREESTWSV
jgi:hypothetical protein